MKQSIALIFLLAFAMQSFSSAFVVLDYFVNTGSFAKNCENKARPAMHCNGKCQMMKKIKEEEKKEQQDAERKAENKNEVLSTKSFFASLPANFSALIYFAYQHTNNNRQIKMPRNIFHPPGNCCNYFTVV